MIVPPYSSGNPIEDIHSTNLRQNQENLLLEKGKKTIRETKPSNWKKKKPERNHSLSSGQRFLALLSQRA